MPRTKKVQAKEDDTLQSEPMIDYAVPVGDEIISVKASSATEAAELAKEQKKEN